MLTLLVTDLTRQLEQRVAASCAKTSVNVLCVLELKESKSKYRRSRLNGADIAPVQKDTLKELFHFTHFFDIDYAWEETGTTYGKLGVKVMDLPW